MKKILFLSLIISLIIVSCTQQEVKSPIEGAWQQVGFSWVSGDTITNYNLPSPDLGSQIKMWTKNHFAFMGIMKTDTTDVDLYGGGTYSLNGDKYEESIIYHYDKTLINTKFKALLEIRNDTLFQTYHPIDSIGKEMENYSSIEKYIQFK
jgi:hypothetical protein